MLNGLDTDQDRQNIRISETVCIGKQQKIELNCEPISLKVCKDKQKALRHDCIYNIENRDLEIKNSDIYLF